MRRAVVGMPAAVVADVFHRARPCVAVLHRAVLARGYDSYTFGDATQQTLREIWNGAAYQDFRTALLQRQAARPLRRLWDAVESVEAPLTRVAAVIPTLNEAAIDRRPSRCVAARRG